MKIVKINWFLGEKVKKDKVFELINPAHKYSKIKYKNEIYNLNDYILIKPPESSEKNYLIGKILKIISSNGIEKYPYWPCVEIQW